MATQARDLDVHDSIRDVLWRAGGNPVAWFNGQTVGKMLCRIRVTKIDAKPLSFWESFERYGGYSAGLATGLLGFLQIMWDPNRQAIHDKISETVVLDLRKPDRIN